MIDIKEQNIFCVCCSLRLKYIKHFDQKFKFGYDNTQELKVQNCIYYNCENCDISNIEIRWNKESTKIGFFRIALLIENVVFWFEGLDSENALHFGRSRNKYCNEKFAFYEAPDANNIINSSIYLIKKIKLLKTFQ
jgi:hypothetical protein